jgi:hypothetical protein
MADINCPDGGTMKFIRDDYGSLAIGGSYEIWDCTECGRVWIPLPD